jgi:hypothetical protein
VYNAYFYMALTFGFTAWGLNLALLYVPLCNGEESSLAEYAQDHRGRIVSVASGLACGVGMAFQFLGGLAGGYAIALANSYSILCWVLLVSCSKLRGGQNPYCSNTAFTGLLLSNVVGRRYRVAEVVKMYPLLTAAWGLLLFTEFRGCGRRASYLLGAMCGTYVLGVGLLAAARNISLVE